MTTHVEYAGNPFTVETSIELELDLNALSAIATALGALDPPVDINDALGELITGAPERAAAAILAPLAAHGIDIETIAGAKTVESVTSSSSITRTTVANSDPTPG